MVVIIDKNNRPLVVGDEYGNLVDRVEYPTTWEYIRGYLVPPLVGLVVVALPMLSLLWIAKGVVGALVV